MTTSIDSAEARLSRCVVAIDVVMGSGPGCAVPE
jgi:hypothetical protein